MSLGKLEREKRAAEEKNEVTSENVYCIGDYNHNNDKLRPTECLLRV